MIGRRPFRRHGAHHAAWRASLALPVTLLCAYFFTAAVPAHAQRVQTAVVPDGITVGDVFRVAIRVDLERGGHVLAPDSLELPADLEPAGRRVVRTDTVDGVPRVTVAYPLTAWRPGSYTLPAIPLRLVDGADETLLSAAAPAFAVRSVLPADTTGIAPQPAKDVLGGSRLWWPLLLGLLIVLLAAALLYAWWRRRKREEEVQPVIALPAVPPRQAALARLDELAASGVLERDGAKPYYETLTEVLRHYVATVDAGWSVDLTTTELAQRMRSTHLTESLDLTRVLGAADLVKFAQARPSSDTAAHDLAAARAWIERVPAPVTEAPADERRAA